MILPYLDKNKPTKDISLFSIFNLNKLLIVEKFSYHIKNIYNYMKTDKPSRTQSLPKN